MAIVLKCVPLVVTTGLLMLLPSNGWSQDGFRAWIGLYDADQVAWLENENRISELCRDEADVARCYSDRLRPAVSIYTLHTEPSSLSPTLGDLVVVAVPGRGLSGYIRSAGSNDVVPFPVDLFLQDWGYGPYFHQTLLARRDDWFQLPVRPWNSPAWVHRASENENSTIIWIGSGDIIEIDGSTFYVVTAETDALVLRPEQPADMWCREGDPPATVDVAPRRLARSALSDSLGHLQFRLRYLKGC